MNLEPLLPTVGNDDNPELRSMTQRLWFSLVLTVPLLMMAMHEVFPFNLAAWVDTVADGLATQLSWPHLLKVSGSQGVQAFLSEHGLPLYFEAAAVIVTLVLLGQVLAWAASLEKLSEHPLATAIVGRAQADGATLAAVSGFDSVTGQGVPGVIDGQTALLGNARLLASAQVDTSAVDQDDAQGIGRAHRPGQG